MSNYNYSHPEFLRMNEFFLLENMPEIWFQPLLSRMNKKFYYYPLKQVYYLLSLSRQYLWLNCLQSEIYYLFYLYFASDFTSAFASGLFSACITRIPCPCKRSVFKPLIALTASRPCGISTKAKPLDWGTGKVKTWPTPISTIRPYLMRPVR